MANAVLHNSKSHRCRLGAFLLGGAIMVSVLASCSSAGSGDRGADRFSGRASLTDISGEVSGGATVADTEDRREDAVYEGRVLETAPDASVLYAGAWKGQIFVVDQRVSAESGSVVCWLTFFDATGEKISEQMLDYSCDSSNTPRISQTASGRVLFETDETTLDPSADKTHFRIWLQEFALTGERVAASPEIRLRGAGGIEGALVDADGNFYIVNTASVYVFDSSFRQTAAIETGAGSYNLCGVCVDNAIYIVVSDGKSQTIKQIAADQASISDATIRLDPNNPGYSFSVSGGNLYATDGIALCRFDWSAGRMETLAFLANFVAPSASSTGAGADEISYFPISSGGVVQVRKFVSGDEVCLFQVPGQ